MDERVKLIGYYEGQDASSKSRRVWIYRCSYDYNKFLMVNWESVRRWASMPHHDVGSVGYEVEAVFGLRDVVWRPIRKWGSSRADRLVQAPHVNMLQARSARDDGRRA